MLLEAVAFQVHEKAKWNERPETRERYRHCAHSVSKSLSASKGQGHWELTPVQPREESVKYKKRKRMYLEIQMRHRVTCTFRDSLTFHSRGLCKDLPIVRGWTRTRLSNFC